MNISLLLVMVAFRVSTLVLRSARVFLAIPAAQRSGQGEGRAKAKTEASIVVVCIDAQEEGRTP